MRLIERCEAEVVVCVYNSENTSPPFAHTERHDFVMATFTEPTICDVCRKLLRWESICRLNYSKNCESDNAVGGLYLKKLNVKALISS